MGRFLSSPFPSPSQARSERPESGQVLIIFVLLLPVLLGMVALAVDVGSYASDRRTLQNAADAIAIAAAQELPDESAASAVADEWAANNSIDTSLMEVTFTASTSGSAPKVTVEIERGHDFTFARIFGIDNADVSARAAAVRSSYGGGGEVLPWAVPQAVIDGAGNGEPITLKYDANNVTDGNFGAIRVDGSGASTYEDAIMYGSDSAVCAVTTPGCDTDACPGVYPATCAETASECDGADCKPETGNMVGGTRDGVDYRIDNTKEACDTFEEVFTEDASGNYRMTTECNPWLGAGADSLRVIIIPVIDGFGNGSSDDMQIQSFALMFLEGYDSDKCKGNECEITGRFIKNAITIPGLTGAYDPSAPLQVTRLVE